MEDKYKKTMLQLQQYLSNRGGDEQTDDGSSPKHMGVYNYKWEYHGGYSVPQPRDRPKVAGPLCQACWR